MVIYQQDQQRTFSTRCTLTSTRGACLVVDRCFWNWSQNLLFVFDRNFYYFRWHYLSIHVTIPIVCRNMPRRGTPSTQSALFGTSRKNNSFLGCSVVLVPYQNDFVTDPCVWCDFWSVGSRMKRVGHCRCFRHRFVVSRHKTVVSPLP